jgi:predicted nucleotidyltransferase
MTKLSFEKHKELFPNNTILAGYRGSVAHNMYLPNTDPNSIDDIDLMGVFMAPVEHYIGITRTRETVELFKGQYDVVSYEFIKFVRLLLKSNPNVMSLFWIRDNHYIKRHEYGQVLIDNRDLFVSKIAYKSFTGYAYGQLKKMEKFNFEGYMGKKRKKLVEKFHFDCKNASHCIRLLKMSIEFLTTGELNVFRQDAPMLLEIKTGKWTLEQVKEEAARLFKLADEAYIRSKIPDKPEYEKVEEIVKDIMYDYIVKKKTR